MCKKCYPEFTWKTYNTIESSDVYKITFNSNEYGRNIKFIKAYRECMYAGNSKIIPDFILNGTNEIREAFWEGLYDADGDKDES